MHHAKGQIQGSLDVVMRAVKGDEYKPQSTIWKQDEKDLQWHNGAEKRDFIPWTVVTVENAQELLDARK